MEDGERRMTERWWRGGGLSTCCERMIRLSEWERERWRGKREAGRDGRTRGDEGGERLSRQLSTRLNSGFVSCKTNSPFSWGSNPDLTPPPFTTSSPSSSSSSSSSSTQTHTVRHRGDNAARRRRGEDDNLGGEQIPVSEPGFCVPLPKLPLRDCEVLLHPGRGPSLYLFSSPPQLLLLMDWANIWHAEHAE